jgi:hypothetical protein
VHSLSELPCRLRWDAARSVGQEAARLYSNLDTVFEKVSVGSYSYIHVLT